MNTPADVARDVLGIIPNHRRWLKNAQVTFRNTRHCVAGAVNTLPLSEEALVIFSDKFFEVAQEQYPGRFRNRFRHQDMWETRIVDVNDHELTTYEVIRLILEKIAAG